MPSKLQFYATLADRQTRQVTQSMGDWMGFLNTAGRLYKYPFDEQLMIHAQRPDAIACAPLEMWNKPMNRWVKRGSKGIALIDNTGGKSKLKYVFDVADTQDGRYNTRRPFLWSVKPENETAIIEALKGTCDIDDETYEGWDVNNGTRLPGNKLGDYLHSVAQTLSVRYYQDNKHDIGYAVEDSFLDGLDEFNVSVAFRDALTVSTTYALMSRCGIDPMDYFENEDFQAVFDFNTPDSVYSLGKAVSDVSEKVLRNIEKIIKNYERENAVEMEGQQHERSNSQQSNIQQIRGLSNTQHHDTTREPNAGQIRDDEEGLSTETQGDSVHEAQLERDAVSTLPRNREPSEQSDRVDDGRTGETITTAEQSPQSERLDGTHEQSEIPSGGNHNQGIDIQLEETPSETFSQVGKSPDESVGNETVPTSESGLVSPFDGITIVEQSGQLTLLDFPSEQEQIAEIGGTRQAAETTKPLQSATITQEDIDQALMDWNGDLASKIRVYEYMYEHARARDTAKFLYAEYNAGQATTPSPYSKEGLHIIKDTEHILLPWAKVQRRIGQLMDADKFLSAEEKAVADNALEVEWERLSEENEQPTNIEPIRTDLAKRGFAVSDEVILDAISNTTLTNADDIADFIEDEYLSEEVFDHDYTIGSPPPVFFVNWNTAQHDFDMSLYNDRDKIGYNKDGVEYAVGKMGDLTYITTTTGITPWGDITGATNIPRDVWEQMNAYRNGELSDDDVRTNYMSVLDTRKSSPQTETNAYSLSYRFLSDPDRIIVFNDTDPDEIDIVARVHADGEVAIVKENLPQSVIDEFTEYANSNFDGLKESAEARLQWMLDAAVAQGTAYDKVIQTDEPQAIGISPTTAIADYVKSKLETGEKFTSSELFAEAAKAYGDTMANNAFTSKDAYDAMELGVNQYMLSMDSITHGKVMQALDLLPSQTRRTADMERFQQFSTPPSIAYLANWAANVTADDVVLEPSAGIGGIAVFAKKDGATVFVNELDKRRLEILKDLPFDGFFNEDAEQINNIHGDKLEPTVIVMNPPFSSSAERNIQSTKIGAKHIDEALKMLAPNGRLVAIVGQGMADDAPAFRSWWRDIKEQYNVKANIGVDGKNYSKYGTTFGIQLLVIDKTGATTEPVKTAFVEALNDLQNILGGIRDERPSIEIDSGTERSTATEAHSDVIAEREPQHQHDEHVSATGGRTDTADAGIRREPTATSEIGAISDGITDPAPDLANISNDGLAPNLYGERHRGNDGRNDADKGVGRTDLADSGQSHGSAEQRLRPPKQIKTELTDSIFENYEPQPLLIQNVQSHPANISESAAMSAIQPPPVTYKPNLSQDIIDNGVLSDVQLEAVTYAGQSHSQTLPNGTTRGFFLGDGTGVGKGRTVTGIILDNFNKGSKKAVWLSENRGLVPDAKRDVAALFGNSDLVTEFEGGKKADKSLNNNEAILFATYSALSKSFDQSDSNFDKIVNWLGKDFDGVIVFDEAHNMANSTATKGSRGIKKASQRGMAGLAIQEALPNAKIIYSSATGATEVENLRYADRLGLWGEGTAFPNGDVFVSKIKAGGLAAMELIARDMKAMGVYLSRNISYEDVVYDKIVHELTPQQRTIYDELARSWQIVLQNLNKALETTNQDADGTAKGRAYGAFWSAEQRFFNQILTAMQVPSMISDIQKQLDNDNSVVIQLVSTNESAQEREFARLQEQDLDLEDFDLTPKQMLMSYIENSFPTVQFEKYEDDNGNIRSRPVFDSDGNTVINRDAVRQKDELLDKLGSIKVPASALDMIINHFGSDVVAENTGRKRRVVITDGKAKEENIASKKQADVSAFQDGDKRIIIFSKAGGTGKSYHADKSAKNQQHRVHYLLQAGWQADAAVQGFGRSHRSNQVSAPTFSLVTTDLKGQMRFISTIAKRLDQLGALTKGQRQTGSQGLFTAGDNLENAFAADVLSMYYKALILNRVDGVEDGKAVIEKLGLKDKLLDEYGCINTNANEMREVNKFLNRILSLECNEQNAVFDGYAERLHIATEKALQDGSLDRGLENYRADRIVLNETTDIRADEATGATTKYFNLTAYNKTKPLEFGNVKTDNSAFIGFYQSKNTGAVRAAYKTSSMTDEYGNVTENCRLTGQDGNEYLPLSRLTNNWNKLTPETAEKLWDKAVADLPEFRTNNLHLIGGTVLPVWDKLPTENVRIYRVLTEDGDMLIGRVIPEDMIDATLDRLGATREKDKIETVDLLQQIKNGDTVYLDNEWRIVQRRVSNEQRLEVIGADFLHNDLLTKKGLFTERIGYQTRYFIPAEKDTVRILDDVLKISPVNYVSKGGRDNDRMAAKSNSAKGKPSLLDDLERYAQKSRAEFGSGDKTKTKDVTL